MLLIALLVFYLAVRLLETKLLYLPLKLLVKPVPNSRISTPLQIYIEQDNLAELF